MVWAARLLVWAVRAIVPKTPEAEAVFPTVTTEPAVSCHFWARVVAAVIPDRSNRICFVVPVLSWNVTPVPVLQRTTVDVRSVLLLTLMVLVLLKSVALAPTGRAMASPDPMPAHVRFPTNPVPLSLRYNVSTSPSVSNTMAPDDTWRVEKLAPPAVSMPATTTPPG